MGDFILTVAWNFSSELGESVRWAGRVVAILEGILAATAASLEAVVQEAHSHARCSHFYLPPLSVAVVVAAVVAVVVAALAVGEALESLREVVAVVTATVAMAMATATEMATATAVTLVLPAARTRSTFPLVMKRSLTKV